MEWSTWLRMPMTVLLVLAALFALATLVQLVMVRQRLHGGRRFAASGRALLCLLFFALTVVLGGMGYALRGYRLLAQESPVVDIDARILSPQRWALTLSWPDGSTRQVQLAGDDWRVEAVVLKWKLPALLSGLPPLYRLDRLSGRYDDPEQEATAPRTVISFRPTDGFDLLSLKRSYPQWLRVGIPLKCFRDAGADMSKLDRPFEWTSSGGESIVLTEVSLGTVADKTLICKAH
jgi:hypothetical protein